LRAARALSTRAQRLPTIQQPVAECVPACTGKRHFAPIDCPARRTALASAHSDLRTKGRFIMRKLCMALTTVCALATTPLLAAERTEFQISPRAGRGVLKLDQFRNIDTDLEELDTGGLGVSFAVLTPVGLLAATSSATPARSRS
jgi:hypothetical protein